MTNAPQATASNPSFIGRHENEDSSKLDDLHIAEDGGAPSSNATPNTDSANRTPAGRKEGDTQETAALSTGSKLKRCLLSPKFFIGLLLVGFITFVIVDSATTGYVLDAVGDFLDWIEDNPVPGVFVFVLVYFVATVFFIPGSILTLGAGFVFSMAFGLGGGVALGALSVFLGASLGAIVSFLLARYLLREQVGKLSQKYAVFQALDQALQENGLKIFLLLRLSPIIPFNAINYIGGVTSVSLRHYALALFGILPGTVLYVFLGASAGSLTDSAMSGQDPTITIVIVVVGAVFGILAIWLTTRYAKQELARVLEERRLAEEGDAAPGSEEDVEGQTSGASESNTYGSIEDV